MRQTVSERPQGHKDSYRIGIDIGGTFTDFTILHGDGNVTLWKEDSNPANPILPLAAGLEALASQFGCDLAQFLSRTELLVHGTTIATNMLIQRNGPRLNRLDDRFVGQVASLIALQEVANVIEGKAKLLGALNEAQAIFGRFVVKAISCFSAAMRSQQPNLFIIAQGGGAQANALGKLSDGQKRRI